MDRILALVVFVSLCVLGVVSFVGGFKFFLLLWVIAIAIWYTLGWRKVEIGFNGRLLFLEERTTGTTGEGWRWAPFPFDIKAVDCRNQVLKLDPLEVMTNDKVAVSLDVTIFFKVFDTDKYLSVASEGVKRGLDEYRDEELRTRIVLMSFDDVLKMKGEIENEAAKKLSEKALNDWGVEVTRIVIAGIKADDAVTKELELKKREELKREGQRVEARHFAQLVEFFKGTEKLEDEGTAGPGLSQELAYEAALIQINRADPKKLSSKTFGLDKDTVAAIVAAVRRD